MVGDGTQKKSMAYVENVADFLRFALESPERGFRLFNYADKPDLAMNELVSLVRADLGRSPPTLAHSLRPRHVGRAAASTCSRGSPGAHCRSARCACRSSARPPSSPPSARARAASRRRSSLAEGLRRTLAHEFGRGGD